MEACHTCQRIMSFCSTFKCKLGKAFLAKWIQLTLWSQLISLNALLRIRITGLTLFSRNMPKNVRVVGAPPRQGVQKTKIREIKLTAYWFFKSFVDPSQFRQLWQWLIKWQKWKSAENKRQFFSNFSDVLIILVTTLFHILFEFPNY